jgi:hypothetical protein
MTRRAAVAGPAAATVAETVAVAATAGVAIAVETVVAAATAAEVEMRVAHAAESAGRDSKQSFNVLRPPMRHAAHQG